MTYTLMVTMDSSCSRHVVKTHSISSAINMVARRLGFDYAAMFEEKGLTYLGDFVYNGHWNWVVIDQL